MFASPWKDTLIILVILLLFFGPKRLPALSRSIGESIREFKGGIGHGADSDKTELTPSTAAQTKSTSSAASTETGAGSAASEHSNA